MSGLGLRTAPAGRFAQYGVVNKLADEELQNEAGGRPSMPLVTSLLPLMLTSTLAKGGLDHADQHLFKVIAQGWTVDEGIPRHEDGIEGLHHGFGTDAVATGPGTVLHIQRNDETEEVGDGHLHGLVGPGIGLLELAVEDGAGERFEVGGERSLGGSAATTTPLTGVGGSAVIAANAATAATTVHSVDATDTKRSIGQYDQTSPLEQPVQRSECHQSVRTGSPGIGNDTEKGSGIRPSIVGQGHHLLLDVELLELGLT